MSCDIAEDSGRRCCHLAGIAANCARGPSRGVVLRPQCRAAPTLEKRVPGRRERLAILRQYGLAFDPATERHRLGRSQVAVDDLIDAAVCLITARRIAEGRELVLGDGAVDFRALRMEIVA